MTPPPVPDKIPDLLFAWEKSRSAMLSWLPGFLLLSILAHIGTFFLFSVVYPERATIPPPPPSLTVLSPASPENQALLRWIDSEDPARIALPPEIEPPELLKAQYRPSYTVIRTATRGLAENASPGPAAPPARDPFSIIRGASETAAVPPAPAPVRSTSLEFSGTLAGRAVIRPAPLHFSKTAQPLEPARFLVGVTDRGEVRFCFGQKSSGDPVLDGEAEKNLRALSFEPNAAPITWGVAQLDWGDDVYSNAPASPTPAS